MNSRKNRSADLCSIALMTAVTAVMAQITIPMPLGVPMTMQTFAVTLAAVVLGAKRSAISMTIYLLLGMAGVPVFAGFRGGLQCLAGPASGFLISFPLMAFLIGLGVRWAKEKRWIYVLFLIAGTLANYGVGTIIFCLVMKASISTALAACVLPFIPTAIIKAVFGSLIGFQVRRRAHIQYV